MDIPFEKVTLKDAKIALEERASKAAFPRSPIAMPGIRHVLPPLLAAPVHANAARSGGEGAAKNGGELQRCEDLFLKTLSGSCTCTSRFRPWSMKNALGVEKCWGSRHARLHFVLGKRACPHAAGARGRRGLHLIPM